MTWTDREGESASSPGASRLEELVASDDIRDRAFAASELRLRLRADNRDETAALYARVRETARAQHAELRRSIHDRTLDKEAFVARLRAAPIDTRDHLVEEILDIAYPPLDELALPRDAIPYVPSGLDEILFVVERARLDATKTFLDLGAGLGKVILLVALLTGAHAVGVELDPHLVSHARDAATSLNIDNAHFVEADIRVGALPPTDVVYMYIPLTRSADLAAQITKLTEGRTTLVFAQALDLTLFPTLRSADTASYWLEMYERRSPS